MKIHNGSRPSRYCIELVRRLQQRLNYQWITSDSQELWQINRVLQVLDQHPERFVLGITFFANLRGDARLQQHVLPLKLQRQGAGILSLEWAESNPIALRRATLAFGSIYPLEYLVADMTDAVAPWSVKLDIPVQPVSLQERLSGSGAPGYPAGRTINRSAGA